MAGTEGCLACDLVAGRVPLPGGRIASSGHLVVEHCVGPLGLGSLIVKPLRHVTAVAGLSAQEAAELGPLLRLASQVAAELTGAEQVYNCLWSHAGGEPVHIHYLVQPVTRAEMERYASHGPALQAAMFAAGELPEAAAVEQVAERARALFAGAGR